jgi:hypothetical protein
MFKKFDEYLKDFGLSCLGWTFLLKGVFAVFSTLSLLIHYLIG